MQGNTHSFIVRTRREETEVQDSVPVQHGCFEQVSTKRRLYFEEVEEILLFIQEQTGAGTKTGRWGRR